MNTGGVNPGWEEIERVMGSALELPEEQRAAFLSQQRPEVRSEVESLLAAYRRSANFLGGETGKRIDARADSEVLPKEQVPRTMGVHTGTLIGPYRIDAIIGEGGMGVVYRALDTKLNRPTAVKFLFDELADSAARRRFQRESQMASSLNHPHIMTVYDAGDFEGRQYLVTEFVDGGTLKDWARAERRTWRQVVELLVGVTDGLAAAHEAGILHRDIKPDNILVGKNGYAKLADFGLAKLEDRSTPEGITVTEVTRPGILIGTIAYMSPEQASGRPTDQRSDIFSFGVVLYELLSGRRPFAGATDLEVLQTIIHGSALPLEPDVPLALRMVVEKAIEKDPSERYQSMREMVVDLRRLARQSGEVTGPATNNPSGLRRWKIFVSAAVIVGSAASYFYFHRVPKLTDKDTIVLADFINKTADPVFDGTLRQGLAIQLEQSPFLSMVSDESIQKTLSLMGQKADAGLTPENAKEICERTGSAAVLEGSIASLGSKYVLGLRAKNCRTGVVLDEEQVQADKKEDVLNVLSQIAIKFRTKVGESLATVKQHGTPLEEATTTSLEALKAYSGAWKHLTSDHDIAAGVPLFKRAIEIDPKFALAHAALGFTYGLLSQPALSAESNQKAYELRGRASDREKFLITATYETQVTGNLEKALQTCELWVQTYPREKFPRGILGAFVYPTLGKYEKGIEVAKQMVEMDPDFPVGYLQLAFNTQFAGHVDEAEKVLQRASERKLEIPELAVQRYDIAFLKGDLAGMDREAALARSAANDLVYARQGFVLAYSGRLREARLMSQRAVDLNQEPYQRGKKALFEIGPALWDALFGNLAAAKKGASAVADLSMDRDLEYAAAFALALSGETSQSRSLEKDLATRFPEDTGAKGFYLPAIRALLELSGGEPSKAIDVLQASRPYDRGLPPAIAPAFIGPFYTVYVRGLAYLVLHQGAEAAAEFQKILDGRTIVVSDPIGALARLQLGRAFALSGDRAKASAAYQDFLTLWKDADPGIPILKDAKAEFARLAR